MPVLQQPGANQLLVSVPMPQPVATAPRQQKAPAPQQQPQVQQPSDESLFHQVASPPILLLPYGPVSRQPKANQPVQQKRGQPLRLGWRAPAGGMVVRGIFYPGGEIIPNQVMQTPQKPSKMKAKEDGSKKESAIDRLHKLFSTNAKASAKASRVKMAKDDQQSNIPEPPAPEPQEPDVQPEILEAGKKDPTLAMKMFPRGHEGYRVPRVMQVIGGLHYIRGNSSPYFSLTSWTHRKGFPNQAESGGANHEEILRNFPQFADLSALHLSDINGEPMHAVDNGHWKLRKALGIDRHSSYDRRNFPLDIWKPNTESVRLAPLAGLIPEAPAGMVADKLEEDGRGEEARRLREHTAYRTEYRLPTDNEYLQDFANHLRVTPEEAKHIVDSMRHLYDFPNVPNHAVSREAFSQIVAQMRPRWKKEAQAAIKKHKLKLYGDVGEWLARRGS